MTTLVLGGGLQTLTDFPSGPPRGDISRTVNTLADLPFHVLEHSPRTVLLKRAVGTGFVELTGAQLFERVQQLTLGLLQLGITRGDRVAIISDSRPEWVVADLASIAAGAVTVPVYPTQSAHQVEFILRDSRAKAAVVSGTAQLEKVRRIRQHLADLDLLLVIDELRTSEPVHPDALPLSEVTAHGQALLESDARAPERFRAAALRCDEHDVATIVYTVDESGDLKGAMLTHANLLANVRATEERLPLHAGDLALSLLPLSHVFERMALYRYLYDGVPAVFVESLMTVMRDLRRVQPTVMTGVPRVYEKFLGAIEEELARTTLVRRRVGRWAVRIARKRAALVAAGRRAGFVLRPLVFLADRLVLARIRRSAGGRLRCLVCGSAALPARVAEFFEAIGLPIYEGYGLTETSPVLTANGPGNVRRGTVGRPLTDVEIRIADDGEILARGPNLMVGYHCRPDLNEVALAGGWFHTGDKGTLDQDGFLTIAGRKKDLIVTAGGKKVAPSPLEAFLMRDPLVADAVLVGENRKFISVLIVPDFWRLDAHLRATGLPSGRPDELVQRADVLRLYQNLVDRLNAGLAQFERIKRLALVPTTETLSRSPAGDTMLARRAAFELQWKSIVDRVYATGAKDGRD